MKRAATFALVCAALAAGFAGSLAKDWLIDAKPVEAQVNPLKVGLLDLETVCRKSKKFLALKVDWEKARAQEKGIAEQMKSEYDGKKAKLRQVRADSGEADILKAELAALEQNIDATQKVQKEYLSRLLEEYQKQVLDDVCAKAEAWCLTNGYHLVLQDYRAELSDSDMFTGSAYAERMLNKPVLFAPGVAGKNNAYVTDITEAILALVG